MGQVLPFIARVRDSGDWSAAERSQLESLADRLAADGVDVEVIFGATDEGDPWCVVTDGAGDVLIHVARIGGRFVVHSALDDTVDEDFDLHGALRERLAVTEELAAAPASATILPFTARQGQGFLALVVAAAFFYETAGVLDEAQAAEPPRALPSDEAAPAPAVDDAPTQDREVAVQGAARNDPEHPPVAPAVAAAAPVADPSGSVEAEPPRPAPVLEPPASPVLPQALAESPPSREAVAVIRGSAGDDLLVGTDAAERLEGGAGNDTLQGGGGGDTLLGGAGDDRIELADAAIVEGGAGADTFVVALTAEGDGHPDALLGVILDFSFAEGDQVITATGRNVDIPHGPGDKILAPPTGPAPDDFGVATNPFAPTTLAPPPPTRVDVDVDGDGVSDGYLLVVQRGPQAAPPPPQDDPVITITGQSLGADDLFG